MNMRSVILKFEKRYFVVMCQEYRNNFYMSR